MKSAQRRSQRMRCASSLWSPGLLNTQSTLSTPRCCSCSTVRHRRHGYCVINNGPASRSGYRPRRRSLLARWLGHPPARPGCLCRRYSYVFQLTASCHANVKIQNSFQMHPNNMNYLHIAPYIFPVSPWIPERVLSYEAWVKVPAGKTVDRKGQPLMIKLKGKVEAYYK
jgi:hypothetical protein